MAATRLSTLLSLLFSQQLAAVINGCLDVDVLERLFGAAFIAATIIRPCVGIAKAEGRS